MCLVIWRRQSDDFDEMKTYLDVTMGIKIVIHDDCCKQLIMFFQRIRFSTKE
jgi:hypothetical protein